MSGLSHQQAVELLENHPEEYRTPGALTQLANQVSVFSDGQVTLLYGGMVHKDISSNDLVELMVANREDIRAINKTPVASFLQSEAYLEAVARAHNCKSVDEVLSNRSHPANQFMFDATHGRWADASARFVAATKGEVRTLSGFAGADRTLGLVELPGMLKNQDIPTINGKPKELFQAIFDKTHSLVEVFKAVAASSYELMSKLEIQASTHVNKDGSEKKVAEKMGSKALFEGTSYQGTSLAVGEANLSLKTFPDPQKKANIDEGRQYLENAMPQAKAGDKVEGDEPIVLSVAASPSSRVVALAKPPVPKIADAVNKI